MTYQEHSGEYNQSARKDNHAQQQLSRQMDTQPKEPISEFKSFSTREFDRQNMLDLDDKN